ncbi:O-antigen polymerase [Erysipelothrix urinaevulpis]|uniref:O-antigen polymerase n=1 Tax=Erysipelothrix urinaevulpis TaxID=2683717 RepID=UPI001358BBE7|nr:O-antigen polymerase [Erysipelothrix urinaevulpis]
MNDVFKKISSIYLIIIIGILTYLTSSPVFHVVLILGFLLYIMVIYDFEITHPLVWFSGFYIMYSYGYTMIHILEQDSLYGYTNENSLYSLAGLLAYFLFISYKSEKKSYLAVDDDSYGENTIKQKLLKIIIIIASLFIIMGSLYVSRFDFNRKAELVGEANLIFRLTTYLTRYVALFITLYILKDKEKMHLPLVLFSGFSVILFSFVTAERDAIFRFVLLIFIAYFVSGRLNKKMLLFYFLIGFLFIIFMSNMKYFFISGEISQHSEKSFLVRLLYGDFYAPGENMQLLINNSWTKSSVGYSHIFLEVITPFIMMKNMNLSLWFHDTFYAGSHWSRAFTLIGQGYVVGGYFGVILIFSIVGALVNYLFKKSKKSLYWLVIYLYSIANISSSFRGTLYGIIDNTIKVPLIGIGALILIDRLSRRRL